MITSSIFSAVSSPFSVSFSISSGVVGVGSALQIVSAIASNCACVKVSVKVIPKSSNIACVKVPLQDSVLMSSIFSAVSSPSSFSFSICSGVVGVGSALQISSAIASNSACVNGASKVIPIASNIA